MKKPQKESARKKKKPTRKKKSVPAKPRNVDARSFEKLMEAIDCDDEAMLRTLIDGGIDVNAQNRHGDSAVLAVVQNADRKLLKVLIEAGANLDTANKDGWSPLIQAAHDDRPDLAEMLIDAGADLNFRPDDVVPLGMAIGHSEKVARMLIEGGADVNLQPRGKWPLVMSAVITKRFRLVSLLLAAGADPSACNRYGWNAWMLARHLGEEKVTKQLLDAGANQDGAAKVELFEAIANNQFDRARELIESGVDVNQRDPWGKTPLLSICSKKETQTTYGPLLDFLLEAGADLDATDEEGFSAIIYAAEGEPQLVQRLLHAGASVRAGKGWSVLHTACRDGNTGAVRALLAAGAKVNHRDREGRTPLHWAAVQGLTEIVELLIEHGADVNVQSKDKDSALITASGNGHLEVVRRLLQAGADAEIKDYALKETALHHACKAGHADIVAELLSAGADPHVENRSGYTPLASTYSRAVDCGRLIQRHVTREALDAVLAEAPPNQEALYSMLARKRQIASLADWCAVGNTDVVRGLLAAGVSANECGAAYMPPLFQAVQWRHIEIVRMLLEAGADVDKGYSQTPLQKALEEPRVGDIIRLLLEHAADTSRVDPVELEPYRRAAATRQVEVNQFADNDSFSRQLGDFDRAGTRLTQQEFDDIARRHWCEFTIQFNFSTPLRWERLWIDSPADEIQLLHGPDKINDEFQANLRRLTIDGLKIDRGSVRASNWSHGLMRNCSVSEADFDDTMFAHSKAEANTFYNCPFNRSDWSQRSLSGNVFQECWMEKLDLERATLDGDRFERCIMRETNLRGAHLSGVTFERCDLRASNLIDATFVRCTFNDCVWANVNLEVAEWIDCTIEPQP